MIEHHASSQADLTVNTTGVSAASSGPAGGGTAQRVVPHRHAGADSLEIMALTLPPSPPPPPPHPTVPIYTSFSYGTTLLPPACYGRGGGSARVIV